MDNGTNQSIEEQRRLDDRRRADESFLDPVAKSSNYDWIMQNIRFGIEYPQQLHLQHGMTRTDEQLERQLKQTWWKTVEAAKRYPADDEGRQYKLVAWIAGARARGTVSSTTQETYIADGDKVLWQDLPFFERALEDAWADRTNLSAEEWINLNAFVSRLVAVTGMDLMHFGLETIKEALEQPRPMFPDNDEDRGDQKSVVGLLPSAIIWLRHSHSFMKAMLPLIERAFKDGKQPPPGCGSGVAPGELALANGVIRDGMSLARQRFWRHRLNEIGGEQARLSDGTENGRDVTVEAAEVWARRLGTWNISWPSDLLDVSGWEEPIKYQDSAARRKIPRDVSEIWMGEMRQSEQEPK